MNLSQTKPNEFETKPISPPPLEGEIKRGWLGFIKKHPRWTGLGVIFLILLMTGIAIYGFQSESGFVRWVSRVVPYPAARVDDKSISYYKYLREVRRTEAILENSELGSPVSPARIREEAFERLIQHTLLGQLAKENDISVSRRDITDRYGTILEEGDYTKEERALLKSMLRAFLLADRLQDKLGAEKVELTLSESEPRIHRFINP